jgi:hypothetical protein
MYPVALGLLGRVESLVRSIHKLFNRDVCRGIAGCHPHTDGEPTPMRRLAIGNLHGIIQIHIWQHCGKFLSPVTGQ